MIIRRSKVEQLRRDNAQLLRDLRQLLAAADALRKEEANPVPCFVMKDLTRKHLYKLTRDLLSSPLVSDGQ